MPNVFTAAIILSLCAYAQASALSPRATCKSLSASSQIYKFDNTNTAKRYVNGRSYLVHIPAFYQEQVPHAVVLSFHGNKGTSGHQKSLSQLAEPGLKINNADIISVFPQALPGDGTSAAWLGAPYADPNAHDVIFVNNILDELSANLCVDDSRIYASGKSNGGGFVNRLACTPSTSARIAAFALVSSALYPDTRVLSSACDSSNPTRAPILISHGTADHVIEYTGKDASPGGDPMRYTPDIDRVAEWWAGRNGYGASDYNPTTKYGTAQIRTWPKTGKPRVIRYKVAGLGHAWPTTQGLDDQVADAKATFNLTRYDLIDFFSSYTLPGK